MEKYFIKKEEITLRSICQSDEAEFIGWHNNPYNRDKIGSIFPFSSNTFKAICKSYNEEYPSNVWFAICEKDELIGIAGLHGIKYIQRNAEVALLIGKEEERNKGKGKIVLNLIEEYAFNTLNMHRLYAYIYQDNTASLKFMEKCAWELEGVLKEASFWNSHFRNVEVWAKLASN